MGTAGSRGALGARLGIGTSAGHFITHIRFQSKPLDIAGSLAIWRLDANGTGELYRATLLRIHGLQALETHPATCRIDIGNVEIRILESRNDGVQPFLQVGGGEGPGLGVVKTAGVADEME